jgi:hypothetical protein
MGDGERARVSSVDPRPPPVTPVVRAILFVTVAAFFAQQTVPGLAGLLVFLPQAALARPWTVLTYMLLHGGLTHILFNMLALYFFGPRVEARLGARPFLTLYLLSGVSGALLSFLLASYAPIIGASAGVFGVSLAFAYFWPTSRSTSGACSPSRRACSCSSRRRSRCGAGSAARAAASPTSPTSAATPARSCTSSGSAAGATGGRSRWPPCRPTRSAAPRATGHRPLGIHEINREEVDRLLDKISAQGIGSLTPQEQLFLSNFVPPDDRKPVS